MSGFWNMCWHPETTEPDADGKAVCLKCGEAMQVQLTRGLMLETFEQLRRSGYHSMSCVETDEGWCCAPACPSLRRAASSP